MPEKYILVSVPFIFPQAKKNKTTLFWKLRFHHTWAHRSRQVFNIKKKKKKQHTSHTSWGTSNQTWHSREKNVCPLCVALKGGNNQPPTCRGGNRRTGSMLLLCDIQQGGVFSCYASIYAGEWMVPTSIVCAWTLLSATWIYSGRVEGQTMPSSWLTFAHRSRHFFFPFPLIKEQRSLLGVSVLLLACHTQNGDDEPVNNREPSFGIGKKMDSKHFTARP